MMDLQIKLLIYAKKFEEKFEHIRIINLEKNMGVSYARNVGIKESKGDYIHFVDSDDFIEKNMYSEINNKLKKINVDIIITGTIYNEDNKVVNSKLKMQEIKSYEDMKVFLEEECIKERKNVFNYVWNKLYKREFIIDKKIFFDEKVNFGEDFLFNCEALKNTQSIYALDKSYYNYMRRKNYETLKMKFIKNKAELRLLFWDTWTDLYKFYNSLDKVEKQMQKYEGYKIYMALISVANKNCYLEYNQKLDYIKQFNEFKNSEFLYKYMSEKEALTEQLKCLRAGQIEKFYDLICKSSNG